MFFDKYLFDDYVKYVNIVNVNNQKYIEIAFDNRHSFSKFIKQRLLLLSIVNYLIFLYNSLSRNEIVENFVHDDYLKTNARQNNFHLIFLTFFVL